MRLFIITIASGWMAALAAPTAEAPKPGATFRDCADCPEMVVIPPGSFVMGSTAEETTREETPDRDAANEKPQHRVAIKYSFAVMKTEVTRGAFAAFVAATGHQMAEGCKIWDQEANAWGIMDADANWQNPGFAQTDAHPVVCVQWADADAYAKWMSQKTGKKYRLLSDAEFEWLLRGRPDGTAAQTVRWWGDERDQACRYANVSDLTKARVQKLAPDPATTFQCDDGYAYTAPVGTFAANPLGVHDLFGNAWEWVQDCFYKTYEGAPGDGSARLGGDCSERLIRGGAWHADPWYIRAAKHDWAPPELNTARVGIRLARDLE
jgi:formylglycine-generating enzyme required for sulfatase activity